ncbi:MAG TPA: hypothetical protein VFF98_10260, partial [Novosphingobium sp.]|nr:hypothetical protein [Novosphingobium sp.]
MTEAEADPSAQAGMQAGRQAGKGHRPQALRVGLWGAGVMAVALGCAWAEREGIARHLIDSEARRLGLEAAYRIEEIGPGGAVLADLRLGDPSHPDLYVRRIEIGTGFGQGLPAIARLRLEGVRLRGAIKGGRLGFGALDRLLAMRSSAGGGLPDVALDVADARASITGEAGPIGVALAGAGA